MRGNLRNVTIPQAPFLLLLPKIASSPGRRSRACPSIPWTRRLTMRTHAANVTARCPDVVVSPLQRRQPGPPATVEARCRAAPRHPSGRSPCWPSPPSPGTTRRRGHPRPPPPAAATPHRPPLPRSSPRHRGHLLRLEVHRPGGQERPRPARRPAPSTPTSTSHTRPAAPHGCRRSSPPTASAAARPTRPASAPPSPSAATRCCPTPASASPTAAARSRSTTRASTASPPRRW